MINDGSRPLMSRGFLPDDTKSETSVRRMIEGHFLEDIIRGGETIKKINLGARMFGLAVVFKASTLIYRNSH